MTATALTVQTLKSPFASIAAGNLDITLAASDEVGGNTYAVTGKELLLLHNNDSGAQTVTITSIADEKNRLGTITDYSLAAGDYAVFSGGYTSSQGWKNSSGLISFQTSSSAVQVAALRVTQ